MIAGNLNRRITIEKETTSKNAIGTPIETYVALKTTYASISYQGGRTEFEEEGSSSSSNTTFTIRYDSRINYKCRILFNSSYYKILHIELIGRNEGHRMKTIMFDNE